MAWWGIDDGGVVASDAGERLGQKPLGRCFHEIHPFEGFVLSVIEPLGRAGLRIGINQRD